MKFSDRLLLKSLQFVPSSILNGSLGLLPMPSRNRFTHRLAKLRFDKYMTRTLRTFALEVEPGLPGPAEIIMKTAVLNQQDAPKKLDPNFYFESGYTQMLSWLQTLERYGFNLRTANAIMEVGCGSARLIRHLRCIDGIRLVGADLDADMMTWCTQHLQGIEFHVNGLRPPFDFAKENTFDLIFMASVFTHIPLDTQRLWIEELCRVLKPGGFLLCDVLGRYHREHMFGPDEWEKFKAHGELTLTAADKNASLSTKVIGSWDVFQTRAEVLRVFGSVFSVRDYLPGSLDLLVLQKPIEGNA